MASYKIRNRKTNELIEIKEDKSTLFLYGTIQGRLLVKLLSLKWISSLVGLYMDSPFSKKRIENFIFDNKIDMSDYNRVNYPSFNAFFTREINPERRLIDYDEHVFISPCDAKLMVYKINVTSEFKIKDSYYSVNDLIGQEVSEEYINGYVLIFRLCVDDYHRYIYIDNGFKEDNHYIDGVLHTVRPIALKYHNIYKQNAREWTVLHTNNFDDVIEVEVGAMMVGKIVNHHPKCEIKRGTEKGYFKFGGSTIVLLVKENVIKIDDDIISNSNDDIETIVKLGEKIGKKIN